MFEFWGFVTVLRFAQGEFFLLVVFLALVSMLWGSVWHVTLGTGVGHKLLG